MLQKVRKFWIFLAAFQNNFEKQIHSVCINNYSAKEGLIVLAVLAVSKYGLGAINLLKSAPFVVFNKEFDKLPQFKAFAELSEFLALVDKKKVVQKFRNFEEKLKRFVELNDEKKAWHARKAIRFLNEFCDGVCRWNDGAREFVLGFDGLKRKVLAGAAEVNISGLSSSVEVVHMLINKF